MVILETVRFLKNMLQEEYLPEMEVKNDKDELKKVKQAFKKGWFFRSNWVNSGTFPIVNQTNKCRKAKE